MKDYRLLAFDLDETLAPSKSPLPGRMAAVLAELLGLCEVCIISGGQFGQFEAQVLSRIEADEARLERLHLMPTCGTRYVVREDGAWRDVYARNLSPEQVAAAFAALEREARRLGLWEEKTWGPILEDRGSQVTFSALGQQAPVEAKKAWDPDRSKKETLRAAVAPLLPELEVRSGGSTSIDITAKGVDKAYGIEELAAQTGIPVSEMLFVGDRLDEGGNDYPVIRTGIDTHAVTCWEDTADFLEGYIAATRASRTA